MYIACYSTNNKKWHCKIFGNLEKARIFLNEYVDTIPESQLMIIPIKKWESRAPRYLQKKLFEKKIMNILKTDTKTMNTEETNANNSNKVELENSFIVAWK